MTTNPLSTVGLMLTLAGLVGSFFNIQLSQWLRDMQALLEKIELNEAHGTDPQKRAIVECRIEHRKLTSPETVVINVCVAIFVVFVLVNGLVMIQSAHQDPLFPHVSVALWVFLAFFVAGSGWLMWRGRAAAAEIKTKLDAIDPG